MARLSRLFSRKDAGTPPPDQASAKQRKRVAEVTAAPASSPLPPAPQPDVSVTPPHHTADDGQQDDAGLQDPDLAAAENTEPARRHHRADLRTPQQADTTLRVRRRLGCYATAALKPHSKPPASVHNCGMYLKRSEMVLTSPHAAAALVALLRPCALHACEATTRAPAR